MTQVSKARQITLFALFVLLLTILHSSSFLVEAGSFPPSPDNYWNAGTLPLPSNSQGNLEHCTLESNNLKTPYNEVGFNVYTPPGYASGNQTYPVIYLLHGVSGNEYNYFNGFNYNTFFSGSSGSLPGLIDSGLAEEAILVFVNGGKGSFYDDWDDSTGNGPSSSFPILSETVIMQDVIPFIDANFRTIANRNGRAIEGFSMGSRGAIKLAFSYPDQFCSTIAYAGAAFEAIPNSAGSDHPRLGDLPTEYKVSTITANNAAAIQTNGVQIRLVDGAGDGAAGQGGGIDDLTVQLNDLGIAHEYEPNLAGVTSHEWSQYHQVTGAYGLNFHFACFNAASSVLPAPIILGSGDLFTYLPLVLNPDTAPPPVAGTCN
ncbi:alpha/beta hydrolase [Candidatus Leptofilum sp.]|uniref:alpha/beta hydrolase n=1 Tax=Candidatus Leptofilum sp. TaxID=3241576 RepID=UPI003B5A73BC